VSLWLVPRAVTDPMGDTTTERYDLDGEVVAEVDPRGKETDHACNADGAETADTDPDHFTADTFDRGGVVGGQDPPPARP